MNVFIKLLSANISAVTPPSNLFCPKHHKGLKALAESTESHVCVMSLLNGISGCMTVRIQNTIFLTHICQVISQAHTNKHDLCSCKS